VDLPQSFWDIIEFDEPNTLEDTIRKARYCYEKFKNKAEPHKDWKKKSKLGFKKKGFKSSRFKNHGKKSKMILPTKSVYQQNFPSQSGNKPFGSALGKTDNTKKEPLKCWGCGEEHLLRDYPHRKWDNRRIYNIQEATIVNDVARIMPQIYAALDNRQYDHQDSVVEMEAMISNHLVSILIDPGSNLSYVAPQTFEKCKL
jgi:signal recognition particle subunit SEC65